MPVASVPSPAWLAAALAANLAADALRNPGWLAVLRAVAGDTRTLRLRDVQAAAFAGGAANALVPARAGDALKLALVRRRLPGAHPATLAGTLAVEAACELPVCVGLLAWALACGYLPAPSPPPVAAVLGAAVAIALVASSARRLPRRWRAPLLDGLSPLRSARVVLAGVLPWQLASRAVRLVALWWGLAAFGLPAGPEGALVAMAIDGGTRVRLSPLAGGLRALALASALSHVAGAPVPAGTVIAYVAGMQAARTAVAVATLAALTGSVSPRRALKRARRPLAAPAAEALGMAPAADALGVAPRAG